jgi:MFS family permease
MTQTRTWRTPIVILVCATLILLLSFGSRQSYGLFLAPISEKFGWEVGIFSLAMALQTLIWGLSQPFWGNIADRYGAGRVVSAGLLLYSGGLYCMAISTTPEEMILSTGLLTGFGMSATSLPILLAVVGRAVGPEKRSLWLGIASAGGSSGQFLVVPFSQYFISNWDYAAALIAMAILMAFIVPLTAAVAGRPQRPSDAMGPDQSTREAIVEAMRHRGYVLLVTGFFVCGFQTMFIGAHLPNYLKGVGLGGDVAAWSLSLIGFFNVIGCFIWGGVGGRYSKKYSLAMLYMARSAGIALFVLLPVTDISAMVFASFMGLLWLGTVPLTSGLVAQIFGTQYMAMLYGIAFLSHQVGSFLGIWLGGEIYDVTGGYDAIWWGAIVLGFVAAILHWPIDERPVARMSHQSAS